MEQIFPIHPEDWQNNIDTSRCNLIFIGRNWETKGSLVENLTLKLIQGDFLFHPTTMLRANFLRKESLKYENYSYAEDYKFWSGIAKSAGQFYIENQPLLYYRIS